MKKFQIIIGIILVVIISLVIITKQTLVSPLNAGDFNITYKGVSFTVGDDPAKILDIIGSGSANEDNNQGFIGWDPENRFKYYEHGYPDHSPISKLVNKVNPAQGSATITQIFLGVLRTKRGLGVKDSYKKIIEIYGKPGKTLNDRSGHFVIYSWKEKNIRIKLVNQRVEEIQIY